jgi:hypothetical protein
MALLCAGPVLAAGLCEGPGNLVANCGFETGDLTGWNSGGNLGFTAVTSALYVNSGNFGFQMGPQGSTGFISQNLSTINGQGYTFSFFLMNDGGTPNFFSASWNGSSLLSFSDTGAIPFAQFSFSVTGTGSDVVRFDFQQDPAYWGLDDVSVDSGLTAAPEPGTLAMLLAGIIPVVAIARRRRVVR